MENNYAYIIAIVLLGIFLIYQELKRVNKARLVFRIFAVILALAAVLCLILPIKYHTSRKTDPKSLHFLTRGVHASDLKKDNYYTSDSSVVKELGKQKISYIPDLNYYLQAHPEVTNLVVYGYGLAPGILKNIGVNTSIIPSAVPAGIISASWPDVISASENFQIQGVYNNVSSKPATLVLQGLGTRLDSISIPANQKATFNLQCKPKQIGRAVYQLIATRESTVIETEHVPFQVIEQPKIKVLVLASFPDFEYKFLRNWLFENKYQAYFRTRVSKEKFSIDQVNLDVQQAAGINAATFKNYDLVIADDEELGQLGSSTAMLAHEIEAGLGLVVRLTEQKSSSAFTNRFHVSGSSDSISSTYQPIIIESKQKLKTLPVIQPLYIAANPTQLPLVQTQQGKILTSLAMVGKGQVTATAVSSSFNWKLHAADADYAAYWAAIMNHTARKSETDFRFQHDPGFPIPAEPVAINFQASPDNEIPAFNYQGKLVPLQQHRWLPFYWQANFWPETTGWNEFSVGQAAKQAIFVYGKTDWASLKAFNLLKENEKYAKSKVSAAKNEDAGVEKVEKLVPDWTFLVLFLISMGYLWFETKILQ